MATIKVADDEGETITFIEVDGKRFPNFNISAARGIPDFKPRNDDVFLIAYPKSGSHWIWEVCRMLFAGSTDLDVIAKESSMLELTSHDLIDQQTSPRILNTHLRLYEMPKDFQTLQNKIIYLRRNLKDVAVSFFNHTKKFKNNYQYNGTWSSYLKMIIEGKVDYGSWFDYVKHWEEVIETHPDLQILDLTFEDIKENPTKEIKKIAEFLEVPYNETLIDEINHQCSFKNMKARKGLLMPTEDGESVIYRKGDVGDWMNWFTVAQDEWFNSVYQDKMAGSKLKFKYTI
ncbi:hypothetical protein SNE40_006530 [Patella caerulea]|uniref:Sulfotransferase domain-containing protein n=1 Tax=Patella caerulea TaxID=87958 RepID=A0AAN8PW39_PATCE